MFTTKTRIFSLGMKNVRSYIEKDLNDVRNLLVTNTALDMELNHYRETLKQTATHSEL